MGVLGGVKQRVWPAVRWLLTAAALWFLLPRAVRALRPAWDSRALWWLAAAVALTALATVLAAVRWHRVLAALDLPAHIASLVSHHFAGLFVSNFLPSTIGGDVLRVSRLAATTGESHGRTFASVVLERLTGWVVLPLISLIALAVNPGLLEPPIRRVANVAIVISVITLSLLAVIVVAASNPRVARALQQDSAGGWRHFLAAVHVGIERFRRSPGATAEVLAAGLIYQLTVLLAAFLAAKALGLDEVSWTAILAFMPAVAMVQVLPITVGGLGVREGAFVLFLHPMGVSTNQAIALGVLVYAVNLTVSLLGAPAFAVGTRRAEVPA
jgi:hypothetical protein